MLAGGAERAAAPDAGGQVEGGGEALGRGLRWIPAGLDAAAEQLWQRLREWRAGDGEGITACPLMWYSTTPPWPSSRVGRRPAPSSADFGRVGARKLERYGAALLELLELTLTASSTTTPATVSAAPSATRGGMRSCRRNSRLSASVNRG